MPARLGPDRELREGAHSDRGRRTGLPSGRGPGSRLDHHGLPARHRRIEPASNQPPPTHPLLAFLARSGHDWQREERTVASDVPAVHPHVSRRQVGRLVSRDIDVQEQTLERGAATLLTGCLEAHRLDLECLASWVEDCRYREGLRGLTYVVSAAAEHPDPKRTERPRPTLDADGADAAGRDRIGLDL